MAYIAVIASNRQAEALRMSIGLTVPNNSVDIFFTEKFKKEESTNAQLEVIKDLKLKIYSTLHDTKFEYISADALADKLVDYDRVLPY